MRRPAGGAMHKRAGSRSVDSLAHPGSSMEEVQMTITTSVVLVDDATPDAHGSCRLPGRLLRRDPTQLRHRRADFADWCGEASLELFAVRRAHLGAVRPLDGRDRQDALDRGPAAVCQPWPASTATASRKASSSAIRQPTCGVRRWTTSPAPSASTATSWVHSSCRPDWARPVTTHWPRCWRSTACASPRPSVPTSTTWTTSGATGRSRSFARAASMP